jgi:hypothetical protein
MSRCPWCGSSFIPAFPATSTLSGFVKSLRITHQSSVRKWMDGLSGGLASISGVARGYQKYHCPAQENPGTMPPEHCWFLPASLLIRCGLPMRPPPPESSKLSERLPGSEMNKGKVAGLVLSRSFLKKIVFAIRYAFKASAKTPRCAHRNSSILRPPAIRHQHPSSLSMLLILL